MFSGCCCCVYPYSPVVFAQVATKFCRSSLSTDRLHRTDCIQTGGSTRSRLRLVNFSFPQWLFGWAQSVILPVSPVFLRRQNLVNWHVGLPVVPTMFTELLVSTAIVSPGQTIGWKQAENSLSFFRTASRTVLLWDCTFAKLHHTTMATPNSILSDPYLAVAINDQQIIKVSHTGQPFIMMIQSSLINSSVPAAEQYLAGKPFFKPVRTVN